MLAVHCVAVFIGEVRGQKPAWRAGDINFWLIQDGQVARVGVAAANHAVNFRTDDVTVFALLLVVATCAVVKDEVLHAFRVGDAVEYQISPLSRRADFHHAIIKDAREQIPRDFFRRDLLDAGQGDFAPVFLHRQDGALYADDALVCDDDFIVAPFQIQVNHHRAGQNDGQPHQHKPQQGHGHQPGKDEHADCNERRNPRLPGKRPPMPPRHQQHFFIITLA